MGRWIALLGLVACYAPSAQPGLPCAANGSCPNGQTCVTGVCLISGSETPDATIDPTDDAPPPDAPSPDGPPSDVDGDGIANALDNCSTTQNADQHDEDDDTVGDVCDNCPHVSNTTQANVMEGSAGADMVGDACDPNPTIAGDTIDRFISFHVVPTGVTTTGTWTVSQDSYVRSGTNPATLIVDGVRQRFTAEVGGAEISSAAAGSWLVMSFGENNGRYHDCGFDQIVDDIHDGVLGYQDGTDWNMIFAVHHFMPAALDGPYKIAVTADAAQKRSWCTTSDARGTAATGSRTTSDLAAGTIGIRSDDMSHRLDYLIIFGAI